jgi:hypothetical protein
VPPCRRAIHRAIGNPSPPPADAVRAASSLTNRSKTDDVYGVSVLTETLRDHPRRRSLVLH